MKKLFRIVVAASPSVAIIVSVLSCEGSGPRVDVRCPPPDLGVGFNPDPGVVREFSMRASDGTSLTGVVVGNLNFYFPRDAGSFDVPISIVVSPVQMTAGRVDLAKGVSLGTSLVAISALSEAEAGSSFEVSARVSVRYFGDNNYVPSCSNDSGAALNRIAVVKAVGLINSRDLVFERDFERLFEVTFEWSNVGCGIDSVRGRVEFLLTSNNFSFECADAATFIGDAGAPTDALVVE